MMKHENSENRIRRAWAAVALTGMGLLASGCATVPAYDQAYLSKPNMTFENSLVHNTEPAFQNAFEPGSHGGASANATGCAACQ
jgi:hypothetical protein